LRTSVQTPTPHLMSTLVAPSSLSSLPGRPSWRALVALTLAVALVHFLVLGVAPMAVGPEPSPLANKFITRTIVIAPPAADKPAAPVPAAAPVEAKPAAPAKPRRPLAPTPPKPKPKPYPEPDASAQPAPETPDLTAQAATDSGATPPEAPASAPAAAAPAPGGTENAPPGGTAAAGSEASGTIAGTQALRIPGSVTLDFEATGQTGASPQRGVFGELVWLQDGSRYDGRLTLKAVFFTLLNWHSTGKIGPSGLEPERYSESRKAEVASHFVRDQGQIIFSNNAPSVPLQPGAQDRMSVMMQLGGLLAASPDRYPAGTRISVQTVGVRDGDVWVFVVGDEEKLQLPAGEYTARKLTRTPRKDFDRKLELWLAPKYGYLPVRIKQTEANGDFADAQLRKPLPEGPAN
jgi:outer membrane biosynthesis protein TonB